MVRMFFVVLWSVSSAVLFAQISPNKVMDEVRIDQKLNEVLPLDVIVRDETGREVPLGDFFGKKPVVFSLVYYECPMLCTQILNGMVATFKTLQFSVDQEFDVVTMSIDPSETPELASQKKEQYLKTYGREGSEKGWHFLTGNRESIDRLAEAAGFHYVYDEQTGLFAHGSAIMIVTPGGTLARYFYGIEYPARDMTFALMEASAEKIGSPVDQLLLFCYQYDPATGQYGLLVSSLLKISGILTVVVIGGFVLAMLRKERNNLKDQAEQDTNTGGSR